MVAMKVQTLSPPSLVVLLFKEVPGLLCGDSFWPLFFHLDFIVPLKVNLGRVPRLSREHFVMVFTSFQIKRDLEMSECFSLLETVPPDAVSAV